MKFIEEVVVEEFLPTFRSMLAGALRERGLTQSEVADLLGISQSAVSKYAHGSVERDARIREDDRVRDLVEDLADGLASGETTRVQALADAEVLIRRLERGDLLARLHEEQFPPLAAYEGDFAVHDPDSRLRESERVLASVRRGLGAIENTGGFADLVPAVGSNLVEALPGAETVDDVAGVPGRILDVKGRPAIPADPEFGVSEYVAGVLLAARRAGCDASAALNIRFDPDIVARLDGLGYTTVEFEAPGGRDHKPDAPFARDLDADAPDDRDLDADAPFARDLDADAPEDRDLDADAPDDRDLDGAVAAAVSGRDPDVIYQTGGFGVEPIVYVLAADAPTAVETVREIL